jgi:putative N6-adenine-specific DNA methylase
MCGAGTIAIEAALAAADVAPGRSARSASETRGTTGLPWQRIRQRAHDRVRPAPATRSIYASDVDPRAVAQCRNNAATAGVAGWIDVGEGDVLERTAPSPSGLIVSNPPYGVRLEDEAKLAAFYPLLGDSLKQRFAGWVACLLTGDPLLPKLIGLKPSKRTPLYNGAIECRLFRFEIVEGRPQRASRSAPTAPEC